MLVKENPGWIRFLLPIHSGWVIHSPLFSYPYLNEDTFCVSSKTTHIKQYIRIWDITTLRFLEGFVLGWEEKNSKVIHKHVKYKHQAWNHLTTNENTFKHHTDFMRILFNLLPSFSLSNWVNYTLQIYLLLILFWNEIERNCRKKRKKTSKMNTAI